MAGWPAKHQLALTHICFPAFLPLIFPICLQTPSFPAWFHFLSPIAPRNTPSPEEALSWGLHFQYPPLVKEAGGSPACSKHLIIKDLWLISITKDHACRGPRLCQQAVPMCRPPSTQPPLAQTTVFQLPRSCAG